MHDVDLDILVNRVLLGRAVANLGAVHEDGDVPAQRALFIEDIAARLRVTSEILLEGLPHGEPVDGLGGARDMSLDA